MNNYLTAILLAVLPTVAIGAASTDLEKRAKRKNLGEFKENGPLGMPSYKFPIHAYLEMGPKKIAPEMQACIWLNRIYEDKEYQECSLVKMLKPPQGKLKGPITEKTWQGVETYYEYSPRRLGNDRMRFVLQFGANRKIDATAIIKVEPFEH